MSIGLETAWVLGWGSPRSKYMLRQVLNIWVIFKKVTRNDFTQKWKWDWGQTRQVHWSQLHKQAEPTRLSPTITCYRPNGGGRTGKRLPTINGNYAKLVRKCTYLSGGRQISEQKTRQNCNNTWRRESIYRHKRWILMHWTQTHWPDRISANNAFYEQL